MSDITPSTKTQASEELSNLKLALNSSDPQEVLPSIFKLTSLLRQDLSARDYYNLFLQILDGLIQFSYYLSSHDLSNTLFEKAQHSIEIVPRLYTTIVVGISLYEKNLCTDILDDLIELVKGVQHPLRGLFLRYFLNKIVKNLHKENSMESISFLLKNLTVMNTMWSRITDIEQREALKITVGENVERLSFICTDQDLYMKVVFPQFMEIVRNSDLISQQYLLDCVIQVFPDDFLLVTCDEFIEMACQIQTVLDVVNVVYHTLERLLRFTNENCRNLNYQNFIPLQKYLNCLVNSPHGKNFVKKIEVHGIVLKFSGNDEHKTENMKNCLDNLSFIFDQYSENLQISEIIYEILQDSIQINLIESISLKSFSRAFDELSLPQRKKIASLISTSLNTFTDYPKSPIFWSNCFNYLKYLLLSDESLANHLAIIQILNKRKWDLDFLSSAFDSFSDDESITIFLCFSGLSQITLNSGFKVIIKKCIDKVQSAYLAFQISTICIIAFIKAGIHEEIPNLIQLSGKLYEKILDNSSKTIALYNFIAAGRAVTDTFGFNEKIANYCYKIPKKFDQCCVLLALSHIFWSFTEKNSVKLLENLKRSVKLADLCVAGTKNLSLFVMILNEYLHFMLLEVPTIDILSVNSLIELVFELLALQPDEDASFTKKYLCNTIEYINARQKEGKLQEVVFNYDYKKILY